MLLMWVILLGSKTWSLMLKHVTRIKMESSDQRCFLEPIKVSRWPPNCEIIRSTTLGRHGHFLWTTVNQAIKSFKENNQPIHISYRRSPSIHWQGRFCNRYLWATRVRQVNCSCTSCWSERICGDGAPFARWHQRFRSRCHQHPYYNPHSILHGTKEMFYILENALICFQKKYPKVVPIFVAHKTWHLIHWPDDHKHLNSLSIAVRFCEGTDPT